MPSPTRTHTPNLRCADEELAPARLGPLAWVADRSVGIPRQLLDLRRDDAARGQLVAGGLCREQLVDDIGHSYPSCSAAAGRPATEASVLQTKT
jgi:hypothetical protein